MDYNQIILNILNLNINKNLLDLIKTLDSALQDICYHYLYKLVPLDIFYKKDNKYSEYLIILNYELKIQNKIDNKNINIIIKEEYNYNIIKELINFDYNLIFSKNKEEFVNNFNNKYISNNYKLIKFFYNTGILLENNCFIKNIIDNNNDLDNKYEDIINSYVNKLNINIDIDDKVLNIILGDLIFCDILIHLFKFNYNINFNYNSYFNNLLNKLLNYPQIYKLNQINYIRSLLLNNIKYNHNSYLDLLVIYDEKEYEKHKSFVNFINLLFNFYNKRYMNKYLDLLDLQKDNYLIKLTEYKDFKYIFAILFRPFNYLIKNDDIKNKYIELFNILDDIFYNNIMLYDYYKEKSYKFLLQRNIDDNKRLKNNDNINICIICLEPIDTNVKLILCIICNKYIGHINCIKESVNKLNKCPYCNS
jgi:hypothetical protein